MPRAYSADLRERVLVACERREGAREVIARRFRVAVSSVHLWLKLARAAGWRGPRPGGHGRAPLGGGAEVLAALVAEQSDATLAEYADRLAARTGIRRSPAAICRALQRLGLVRKKKPSGRPSRTVRMSPRRVARRAGRDRSGPPDRLGRERGRHPPDPQPCPGRERPACTRQGALGALAAADRDRRLGAGRRGRRHERRRGDRHGGVPGLRRAGPRTRPAQPARRDRRFGQPAGPQGRAGPRRLGRGRTATCPLTRPT
jgi:transposase